MNREQKDQFVVLYDAVRSKTVTTVSYAAKITFPDREDALVFVLRNLPARLFQRAPFEKNKAPDPVKPYSLIEESDIKIANQSDTDTERRYKIIKCMSLEEARNLIEERATRGEVCLELRLD